MDPLSQGLLGASCAQLVSQKPLPKHAWLIGFLAGVIADLDVLIRWPGHPTLFMTYHRHFTHALLFIPFGGALVAFLLTLLMPQLKPRFGSVLLASTAGYATHGFLDLFTSYGTLYFWPLSNTRVSFDWISIVDPIFTICLLLGVLWGYLRQSKSIVFLCLLLAFTYLGIGGIQHERALIAQRALSHKRLHPMAQHRVMPTLANIFHWRSVYVAHGEVYVDYIHIPFFKKAETAFVLKVPHFDKKQISQITNNYWQDDLNIFDWFSDHLLGVFQKEPLVVADMRYLIDAHPPTSLWGLALPQDKKQLHLDLLRYPTLNTQ